MSASTDGSHVGSASLRERLTVKNGREAHLEVHPRAGPPLGPDVVHHLLREHPHGVLDLLGCREVALERRLAAVRAGDPGRVVDGGAALPASEGTEPRPGLRPELGREQGVLGGGQVVDRDDAEVGQPL